jgi:leukotriene-A4 hydrolase
MTLDAHSRARPDEARVTHVDLTLRADFAAHRLEGTAWLTFAAAPGATELTLDTRGLAIEAVTDSEGAPLAFVLEESDALLGAALRISLSSAPRAIVVRYATSVAPPSPALQWLAPEQTAGGRHPFLFTQGHAIETRSWLPLQDSPAVRITYTARVTVPRGLTAVMSAEARGVEAGTARHAEDEATFDFAMREPIPPYLIALAVGELARHEVGPRSAVLAEPATLARAAYELAELERILEAAETLLGPYRWGRFDVLVMPPSFPYGGMENPRLVFASPSLLAGDRSLVTVIAHELAHAWAGNLVTNATWDDFWINEGTTVYLELLLHAALWGDARAALLRRWGHGELCAEIERMNAPDTRLCYEMTGRDPAEGVTVIPYLKGASFFWALEQVVGQEALLAWLRGWFERRAFTSVTTSELLEDLRDHLPGARDLDLARWTREPGPPPPQADPPASSLFDEVERAVAHVARGGALSEVRLERWPPQALRQFLGSLRVAYAPGSPPPGRVAELDRSFHFSESRNAEVTAPWLRLAIQARLEGAPPRIEAFLRAQGRSKFLRPIYADLLASEWGAPIARALFEETRPRLHALVRAGLDRLFEPARGA